MFIRKSFCLITVYLCISCLLVCTPNCSAKRNQTGVIQIKNEQNLCAFLREFLQYCGTDRVLLIVNEITDFRTRMSIFKHCSARKQLINFNDIQVENGEQKLNSDFLLENGENQVIVAAIENNGFLPNFVLQVCNKRSVAAGKIIWLLLVSDKKGLHEFFRRNDFFSQCRFIFSNKQEFVNSMIEDSSTRLHFQSIDKNLETGLIALPLIGQWKQKSGLQMVIAIEYCCVITTDVTLNVALYEHKPYMMKSLINQEEVVTGLCVDLMKEVAKTLRMKLNFTWTYNYGVKDKSEKWNGMIGEIAHRNSDMALGIFSWLETRRQVVDYLPGFMDSKMAMAVRPQADTTRWHGFLATLGANLWFMVGGSMVILSFSLFIIHRLQPDVASNDQNRQPVSLYITWMSSLFSQQGSDDQIEISSTSGNVVIMTALLFSFMIFNCYTTNLISSIATPQTLVDFTNLEECLQSEIYTPITLRHVIIFLKGAYTHIPQEAFQNIDENNNKYFVKTRLEGIKKVAEGPYVFYADKNNLLVLLANDSVTKVIDDYFKETLSFVMKKNSPYYQLVKREIIKLKENGILPLLVRRYLKPRNIDSSKSVQPIHTEEVKFPLALLASGIVLALLLASIHKFFSLKPKG